MECKICHEPNDDPRAIFCQKCGVKFREEPVNFTVTDQHSSYQSGEMIGDVFGAPILRVPFKNLFLDQPKKYIFILLLNYVEFALLVLIASIILLFIYPLLGLFLILISIVYFLVIYSCQKLNNTSRYILLALITTEIALSFIFRNLLLVILFAGCFYLLAFDSDIKILFDKKKLKKSNTKE